MEFKDYIYFNLGIIFLKNFYFEGYVNKRRLRFSGVLEFVCVSWR